jgi:DNA-binding transcriptional MocR family regulator
MTKQLLRYLRVADEMTRMIGQGTFRRGERIPSVRELSRKLGASPSTVFAAYGELERRGLVEARPQSGFYVRSAPAYRAPEPARLDVRSEAGDVTTGAAVTALLIESGHRPGIVALDNASPDPALMPNGALLRAMARAMRRRTGRATSTVNPPGALELRRAIAVRSIDWGGALGPADLVITNGATEAIQLALRAVARPGDVVAVESPTYYGVLQAIASAGMRALEIPTSPREGLVLGELERALGRAKIAAVYTMPNFANPHGACMPDDAKRELVRLLARADVPLVEDDVAGDLFFEGRRPIAAKAFDTRGLVLLCSSFSKTLAPGFRVGWIAPGRFVERVMELQWSSTSAANTPGQLGLAEFLATSAYDRHLRALRATVRKTMAAMIVAIGEHFPSGVAVTRPRGGLVLWVSLPRGDAQELHRRALERDVAVTPGVIFSPRPTYRSWLRLSCALPWTPKVARAVAAIGRLASELG